MANITDFWIKQGDTLEPIVIILEYGDGTLSTRTLVGSTIMFHMKDASGTVLVNRRTTVFDDTAKSVTYQWVLGDTAESSGPTTPHAAEVEVTYADGNIETFPNATNINIHVFPQVA